MPEDAAPEKEKKEAMPLLKHLDDLRKVLVSSAIATFITSCGAYYFVDPILKVIEKPLTRAKVHLVVTGITEGFFIKLKIALIAGLIIASPFILWQIWRFVVPALYPKEKKSVRGVVPISVVLFIGGVLFAYFTVFQVAVYFLLQLASGFDPMLTIDKYLSFTVSFLLPFGVIFEFPLVVYFLAKVGILTPEKLVHSRKYTIVAIFIVAAVLTPSPDPLSQIIMAIPMLILYEAGILVARVVTRKRKADLKAQEKSN
jgi:sec-independent protein translocase protein TatC